MARSEEYKQRLVENLTGDSAIIARRIAFWQYDLEQNDYTVAQHAVKVNEIVEEQRLLALVDSLADAVTAVVGF